MILAGRHSKRALFSQPISHLVLPQCGQSFSADRGVRSPFPGRALWVCAPDGAGSLPQVSRATQPRRPPWWPAVRPGAGRAREGSVPWKVFPPRAPDRRQDRRVASPTGPRAMTTGRVATKRRGAGRGVSRAGASEPGGGSLGTPAQKRAGRRTSPAHGPPVPSAWARATSWNGPWSRPALPDVLAGAAAASGKSGTFRGPVERQTRRPFLGGLQTRGGVAPAVEA